MQITTTRNVPAEIEFLPVVNYSLQSMQESLFDFSHTRVQKFATARFSLRQMTSKLSSAIGSPREH
jgi:hypothetical protein